MRLVVAIVLVLGVFIAPWWLELSALLLSAMLYRRFYAALVPAVLMDVMHGGAHVLGMPLRSATLLVSATLVVMHFLETYLRDDIRH